MPLLIEGCAFDVEPVISTAVKTLAQQSPLLEKFLLENGSYELVVGYMTECALAGDPIGPLTAIKYFDLQDACKAWYTRNWDSLVRGIDTDALVVQLRADGSDREVLESAVQRHLQGAASVRLALVS